MRCLQCGKNIPLFKRLAESEFCSEAHRREYQQEYSELALGRLLQSKPAEAQVQQVKPPPLTTASAPAVDEPPAVIGPTRMDGAAATKPSAPPASAEKARPATTPPTPAVKLNGITKSHPPPPIPVKKAVPLPAASKPAASQPAIAKPAVIQKPAAAELQFPLMAAPELEHAFKSLAPDKPRREAQGLPAELPQGHAIALEDRIEIADSLPRPMERKLDLREVSRTTPRIALDLRIVPPESLETERRPLTIPVAPAGPAEASLWVSPHCDFAGGVTSLSDFANAQFSKSGFETPPLGGSSAMSPVPETLPPKTQPAAVENEPHPPERNVSLAKSQTTAPTPAVRVPDPELNPLPVSSPGIAPGRAKPLPVFGPAPVTAGTVQIPQPSGLPLRPVIVLVAAATVAGVKKPESDAPSLRSDLSVKPPLQQSRTSAALSSETNPGVPEPRTPTPVGAWASRMRKLLAPLAGAAVLGTGILFFVGKQSHAGLKSPVPALTDGALGGQWIANFAPDARRQRRVALLGSSVNLSAYRLDFESSIQIKALGWVYRAQDSKNFYVSKIELQKPGESLAYALVHYAVIDGVEQRREEAPLHVTVPLGGLYKIHFDAVGNRFTTWVQDQQVAQWTDSRLSSGGAGLYSEGAERSTLHGDFVVTPLLK
jgi:hypothetical protein